MKKLLAFLFILAVVPAAFSQTATFTPTKTITSTPTFVPGALAQRQDIKNLQDALVQAILGTYTPTPTNTATPTNTVAATATFTPQPINAPVTFVYSTTGIKGPYHFGTNTDFGVLNIHATSISAVLHAGTDGITYGAVSAPVTLSASSSSCFSDVPNTNRYFYLNVTVLTGGPSTFVYDPLDCQ